MTMHVDVVSRCDGRAHDARAGSTPQKRPNEGTTQDTHLEAQAAVSEESRCPFPLSPAGGI